MRITLPDGTQLCTHEIGDEHWQKIVRHWVDRHSDEYELPGLITVPMSEEMVLTSAGKRISKREWQEHVRNCTALGKDPGTAEPDGKRRWNQVVGEQQSTGKKRPACRFELEDMPEEQYREMRPYEPHPTCRVAA
jgi:hypothetical protein